MNRGLFRSNFSVGCKDTESSLPGPVFLSRNVQCLVVSVLNSILYHHTILKLSVYFDCGSEVSEYFQVIRPQLIPQKAFCGELQKLINNS